MQKNAVSYNFCRLAVRVTFDPSDLQIDNRYFEALINSAVREVLGETGLQKIVRFPGDFNPVLSQGSVIVKGADLHVVWAALAIFGHFYGHACAIRLLKLFRLDDLPAENSED